MLGVCFVLFFSLAASYSLTVTHIVMLRIMMDVELILGALGMRLEHQSPTQGAPTGMVLRSGRKPESLEKTHTDMGRMQTTFRAPVV